MPRSQRGAAVALEDGGTESGRTPREVAEATPQWDEWAAGCNEGLPVAHVEEKERKREVDAVTSTLRCLHVRYSRRNPLQSIDTAVNDVSVQIGGHPCLAALRDRQLYSDHATRPQIRIL